MNMTISKMLIILFLFTNASYGQGLLYNNSQVIRKGIANNKSSNFINGVSIGGDIAFAKSIGQFNSILTKSKICFDYGFQIRFKEKYSFFVNQEYLFYHNANHPAADHIFKVMNITVGLLKTIAVLNDTKIELGLGFGPYFYERSKDNNGDWKVNLDDVCIGGKLVARIDTPLTECVSFNLKPSINSFKSIEKGWLSYISVSAGININIKI